MKEMDVMDVETLRIFNQRITLVSIGVYADETTGVSGWLGGGALRQSG
jgi:hypothetical protein